MVMVTCDFKLGKIPLRNRVHWIIGSRDGETPSTSGEMRGVARPVRSELSMEDNAIQRSDIELLNPLSSDQRYC